MIAERLAHPAATVPKIPSLAAGLGQAFACFWWLLRAHVADQHGLPRDLALGPPPAAWLKGWPRDLL